MSVGEENEKKEKRVNEEKEESRRERLDGQGSRRKDHNEKVVGQCAHSTGRAMEWSSTDRVRTS